MRKLILPVFCGFLLLWLSTGCVEAAEHESASIPPAQSESVGLSTEQPDAPSTLPSPEATPDTPATPEVVSTPEPTEAVPNASVSPEVEIPPSEAVSSAPIPSEMVYLPGSDSVVTLIYQNPELPNGCEITSLAILLDWAGYPIDKVELSDNYLPKEGFYRKNDVLHGADPNKAYAGDPASYSSGWYCFEGPILKAGNAYLADQNSELQAVQLSGLTQEDLESYMDAGVPMAVWVTLDYSAPRTRSSSSWRLPDGTKYVPYTNLHCVVLAGWDGDDYRIANPIKGWQSVSPDTFWSCFDAMGRRVVAVFPAY